MLLTLIIRYNSLFAMGIVISTTSKRGRFCKELIPPLTCPHLSDDSMDKREDVGEDDKNGWNDEHDDAC